MRADNIKHHNGVFHINHCKIHSKVNQSNAKTILLGTYQLRFELLFY